MADQGDPRPDGGQPDWGEPASAVPTEDSPAADLPSSSSPTSPPQGGEVPAGTAPWPEAPPPGSPSRRGRGRLAVLIAIPVTIVVVIVLVLVLVVGGGSSGSHTAGRHSTSLPGDVTKVPGQKPEPVNDGVLFDPTDPTVVNGRSYHVLAVDQTHDCAADVSASFAAFLRAHGCEAILRGLFVDAPGDILISQSIIVLDTPADASAVNAAANKDSTVEVNAPSTPLGNVHGYPGGTAQLVPAPASAGAPGSVQTADPARSPSGAIYGTEVQNQFVSYNVASYDNGQKASAQDQRLQRASGDVRYAVLDPLLAISINESSPDGRLAITLDF